MNTVLAPIDRLERAMEAYNLSSARVLLDVRNTLLEVLLCLEKCPPEQAQISEAISLLASALWRTLSSPDSAPPSLVADSADSAMAEK